MKRNILFGFGFVVFMFLSTALFADAPPPPGGDPTGGGAGSNATPIGGGANIQGGILILIVLGLGYGAKKLYDAKVKVAEPLENEN